MSAARLWPLVACSTLLGARAATAAEPELVLPLRHSSGIGGVALSPDGRLAASGGADSAIKLWDVRSGRLVRTLTGHTAQVADVAFSPSGELLASASWDGSLRLWRVETGEEVKKLAGHGKPAQAVVFSSDGKTLLSGGSDRAARLWSVSSGALLVSFLGHTSIVNAVAFSPDGRQVASAAGDNTVALWDAASGAELARLRGHTDAVTALAYTPDGKRLLSGSWDQTLRLWDLASRAEEKQQRLSGPNLKVKSLALSRDGRFVAVAAGQQVFWMELEPLARRTSTGGAALVTSVAVSPRGDFVFFGDLSSQLLLWDPAASMKPQTSGRGTVRAFSSATRAVQAVAFGRDDATILSAGMNLAVLNRRSGGVRLFPRGAGAMALSPEGDVVALGTVRGADVVDLATGQPRASFAGAEAAGLAFAPRQGAVAVASPHQATFSLFERASGRLLEATEPDFTGTRQAVAVSADGARALVNKNYTVELWDLADFRRLSELGQHKHFVSALAFSADGRLALSGSFDKTVRLTDIATGATVWEASTGTDPSAYVNGAALSSDGRLVAAAVGSGAVKLWDVPRRAEIPLRSGGASRASHSLQARSVAFSSDGKRLLSGSLDGTTRLWDTESGAQLAQLVTFSDDASWLLSTPDGYYFANKSALDHIHYVQGTKVIGLDQYDLQYNRPDLVLERLGLAPADRIAAYERAWEKRLRKMGFDPGRFESERSFNAPEVTLGGEVELFAVEVKEPVYTLSISARDRLYDLERLFVSVNGVPLYGVRGKSLADSPAKEVALRESFTLSTGLNVIKVSVLNAKGVESSAERREVFFSPEKPARPSLHAVVVGVSKFKDAAFNLTYAEKDARDLAKLLKTAGKRYQTITVHTLTNDEATRASVLALRPELEKTQVDDDVFVFVASHGVLDDELDYYLAMHDMDFASPRDGGLRYDELEGLLDAIPARNKVVLLDACHSGEVDKEEGLEVARRGSPSAGVKSRGIGRKVEAKTDGIGLQSSFELMRELFADFRRNNGAVVIASASGREYAFESAKWRNGVFTYAVLEGLQSGSADLDEDRAVTVTELRDFVSKRVESLTAGAQHPTSRTENPERDFRVW